MFIFQSNCFNRFFFLTDKINVFSKPVQFNARFVNTIWNVNFQVLFLNCHQCRLICGIERARDILRRFDFSKNLVNKASFS
eukprot:UN25846